MDTLTGTIVPADDIQLLGSNSCGSVWMVEGRVEIYLPWDCGCPDFCHNTVTLLQETVPWLDSFYPDDSGSADLGVNVNMVSIVPPD